MTEPLGYAQKPSVMTQSLGKGKVQWGVGQGECESVWGPCCGSGRSLGYSQMLCNLTSSRHVLAPSGFTSVTLIRYSLQNSAPWTTHREASRGSCGHGQGPVDGLSLEGRMLAWILEIAHKLESPVSLLLYL